MALSQTSSTMLSGLRDSGQPEVFEDCWRRFQGKYLVVITRWCEKKWHLNPDDADDVAAEVMIKVLRTIKRFQYDRNQSFRAWIYTVTRTAVVDYWRQQQRNPQTVSHAMLADTVSRDDLIERMQREFDFEILSEARRRVQSSTSERDWSIFVALTETGELPAELAARHGMKRNAVDNVKLRVLKGLRSEIQKLESTGMDSK